MTIPITTNSLSRIKPSSDHNDDHDWSKRGDFWAKHNKTQTNRKSANTAKIPKILSLGGHGVRLTVDNGALVIRNGFTHYPQKQETWRLFAGQRNLPNRIVMLDGNGSLSFDVLAWLSNQQIPLVQINWQGEVITVLGNYSYSSDTQLIEAQRKAIRSSEGLKTSIELIKLKIHECQSTLIYFPESLPRNRAIEKLSKSLDELAQPIASIETLRLIEGRAAVAYFNYWQHIPLLWKGLTRKPIPEEWRSIGNRGSLLSGSNKNATHPVNAMLNYLYGVLEGQVKIAAAAAGLDPTLGFLHANRSCRVALVYDLMEPLRPKADLLLLKFLMSRKLSATDFIINETGVCRLHPQLARNIAALNVDQEVVFKIIKELATKLISS